jgi:hypothetical protein
MPEKSKKPKSPSIPDFIRKMFGERGSGLLGSGEAKRAAKKLKKRKSKVDEAIKKSGG